MSNFASRENSEVQDMPSGMRELIEDAYARVTSTRGKVLLSILTLVGLAGAYKGGELVGEARETRGAATGDHGLKLEDFVSAFSSAGLSRKERKVNSNEFLAEAYFDKTFKELEDSAKQLQAAYDSYVTELNSGNPIIPETEKNLVRSVARMSFAISDANALRHRENPRHDLLRAAVKPCIDQINAFNLGILPAEIASDLEFVLQQGGDDKDRLAQMD